MNIDLAVNDYSVGLGDAFDFESLKNAGFKKVGLLSKALIKTRGGEIVYWACVNENVHDRLRARL